MRVFVFELGQLTPALLARLQDALPPERRAQAERCRHESARAAKAVSYHLLRLAAAGLGVDLPQTDWAHTECGKPYVAGASLHFSLSHTADAVAVAISTHTPIGVDIEQIRPHGTGFLNKYFSEQEQKTVAAAPDAEAMLTKLWCAKEAEGKRTGSGLGGSIADIPTTDTATATLTLGGTLHAIAVAPSALIAPVLVSAAELENFLQ